MPPIDRPAWDYPLAFATQNRETSRTGTATNAAAELLGADGSYDGGTRPFPGFIHYFDVDIGYSTTLAGGGTLHGARMWESRVDATTYAYGVLMRFTNSAETIARYRLQYRIGDSTTWIHDFDDGFVTGLIPDEPFGFEEMSVEVVGRFVYVGRRGKPTFMFYITETSPGVFDLIVIEDTGPGEPPELVAAGTDAVASRALNSAPATPHPDMVEAIPVKSTPASKPAEATVVYCGFGNTAGVSTVGGGPADETNPYLSERNITAGPDYALGLRGPSDLRLPGGGLLWASPPHSDPNFRTLFLLTAPAGAPQTPVYPFPSPAGEFTSAGYNRDVRDIAAEEPAPLLRTDATPSPGGIFMYRLLDSRTGRKSALSNRVAAELSKTGSSGSFSYIYDPDQSDYMHRLTFNIPFPMVYVIYDSSLYDTMQVYRGRSTLTINNDSVIMHLDGTIVLADYDIDSQPAAPWRVAGYFVQTAVDELPLQNALVDIPVYLEDMPPGGALLFSENTMLVGNSGVLDPDEAGVGIVRWSSLLEPAVELFDPADKYALKAASEEVLRFLQIGTSILGWTGQNIYAFHRETRSLKGFPVHRGYGLVNDRAAAEMGSHGYGITRRGAKEIDARGQLADLAALNYVIRSVWAASLESVECAYDDAVGVVWVLNTSLGEAQLLWFETSKITALADLPFRHVDDGVMPRDPTQAPNAQTNPLEKRAVFFEVYTIANVKRLRVWAHDRLETKSELTLMQPTSATKRWTQASNPSGATLTLPFAFNDTDRLQGCYIYVLNGDDAGNRTKITATNGAAQEVTLEDAAQFASVAGQRLGLSPVHQRWVGAGVGLQTEDGFKFGSHEFFRQRQVNTIKAAITDVNGAASSSTDARYRALVYKGNAAQAEESVFPAAPDRTADWQSVGGDDAIAKEYPAGFGGGDGSRGGIQGPSLHPGIEVFCPELRYTLLGVRVEGKILDRGLSREELA